MEALRAKSVKNEMLAALFNYFLARRLPVRQGGVRLQRRAGMAQTLSKHPFQSVTNENAEPLLKLDYAQYQAMHQKLWGNPSSHLHEWWQAAFRHYVESSALTTRRAVAV
jgi:hypothetical protein